MTQNIKGGWRHKVLAMARPYHLERFRRYHDWDHPMEMIGAADALGIDLDDAQFLAVATHDLFCVAGAPPLFNETASELAMRAHAHALGTDADVMDAAGAIIKKTTHRHTAEATPAQAAVLDLDLMRIAEPWTKFEARNDAVQFEYKSIEPSRPRFMKIRAHFMNDMFGTNGIGARRVFKTGLFDEAAAQANIRRMMETYG